MKKTQFFTGYIYGIVVLYLAFIVSCKSEQAEPESDCSQSGLTLTLSGTTDASCGAADGSATLAASGGEGALVFSLSGADQQDGHFQGLSAGNHLFTVTDANGCSETLNVSIENADGVTISSVTVGEYAGCGEQNGAITVVASNGTEPYQYKLDDGEYTSEHTFTALSAGVHTVVVRDELGCEFSEQVEVLSGVSFSTHISPIISGNCAISGCHNGTTGLPDFRNFGAIQANAGRIKTLTGNGTMPKTGSITEEQIDLIACWVDDGAQNN